MEKFFVAQENTYSFSLRLPLICWSIASREFENMVANFRGILTHLYFNFCFWFNPKIAAFNRVQIKDQPIIDIRNGAGLIFGKK
jgi:hypothetical protein